jgi:hypothetical protein
MDRLKKLLRRKPKETATAEPQLERAILSKHNINLLGLRMSSTTQNILMMIRKNFLAFHTHQSILVRLPGVFFHL